MSSSVIKWYARIASLFVIVVCVALYFNFPANADFETKNEFAQTIVLAVLVCGGMLYFGERRSS